MTTLPGPAAAPAAGDRRRAAGSPVAAVILLLALISTLDALAIFARDMPRRDFGAFYHSGAAWRGGGDPYASGRQDLPNLNPPSVVAAVFSPLSRLPLPAAGLLWQLLGAASLAWCAWKIAVAARLTRADAALALGVGLLSVASRYVWLEGQMTWLLLLPATHAWLAYRLGADRTAGFLIGIIVAVKPFFAVAALVLGARAAAAAALAGVSLTLASLPLTGAGPWRDWLALGPGISVTWPSSASFWTLGTRAVGAQPLDAVTWTALPRPFIAAVALSACVLGIRAWRLRDRDARWLAAIALALLISPLGWIYYLPLAAGALVALWADGRWNGWLTAAVYACCIPMGVLFQAIAAGRWSGLILGAVYTWALVAFVVSAGRSTPPASRSDAHR